MVLERIAQRGLRHLAGFFHLLKGGRFVDIFTDPQAEKNEDGAEQERYAPAPAPFGTGFFLNAKTKSPVFRPGFLLYLMPGSSLLSHGETPHYHRRYGVSLLSSAWGQVGPPR